MKIRGNKIEIGRLVWDNQLGKGYQGEVIGIEEYDEGWPSIVLVNFGEHARPRLVSVGRLRFVQYPKKRYKKKSRCCAQGPYPRLEE